MKNIVPINKATTSQHSDYYNNLSRQFLASGGNNFSNDNILEILLFTLGIGNNTNNLTKQLTESFGDFSHIISASPYDLKKIDGLDERVISILKLIRESALRLIHSEIKERSLLGSSSAVLEYCKACMRHLKTEQFHIFFLDKKNGLIKNEVMSEGTIDNTPVYPREVIKKTIEYGASSIILAHNHPSGDPTPSKIDKNITQSISMALIHLDVVVHDHIIIAGNRHFSFAKHGLL